MLPQFTVQLEGTILLYFFYKVYSKWQAVKWATLSGACEPVGALLFGVLLNKFITVYVVHFMLSAGLFFVCLLLFFKLRDNQQFPELWCSCLSVS